MPDQMLKGPFLPRKASNTLRDRVVQYLRERAPAVGDPFFSDAQLVEISGLSRKTVRRALESLCREGWIERRSGKGSFVGPRCGLAVPETSHSIPKARRGLRVGVMIHLEEDTGAVDWYSRGVLDGLDQEAAEHGIRIELLGSPMQDVAVFSRRMMQARPDVLVVMPALPQHAFCIGEAKRQGIPVLVCGDQMGHPSIPVVREDGLSAAKMAVGHLAGLGHKRIGLVLPSAPLPWVFERRAGYLSALAECKLETGDELVYWSPVDLTWDALLGNYVSELHGFIKRKQPTALILGTAWPFMAALGQLQQGRLLRIPQDISVLSFDQRYGAGDSPLGLRPSVVALPLRETGRRLARMALEIADGKDVPSQTLLPCELVEGESVTPVSG